MSLRVIAVHCKRYLFEKILNIVCIIERKSELTVGNGLDDQRLGNKSVIKIHRQLFTDLLGCCGGKCVNFVIVEYEQQIAATVGCVGKAFH